MSDGLKILAGKLADAAGPTIDKLARKAFQVGVDHEQARVLAIVQTVRAGHQSMSDHEIVELLDNIIDLIEGGK